MIASQHGSLGIAASSTVERTPSMTRRMSGMTDCHLHIFGPSARYPYTASRAYTPPEASLASYDALAASLGLERMVIVQPSVYGKDNACTLDMAAVAGKARARAVAVIDDSFSDSQLSELNDRGVRG